MLPAEAPCAYSFAVPSKIVLGQHVGDFWTLRYYQKKLPAGTGIRNLEL